MGGAGGADGRGRGAAVGRLVDGEGGLRGAREEPEEGGRGDGVLQAPETTPDQLKRERGKAAIASVPTVPTTMFY